MTCENAENKASYLYLSPFLRSMTLRLSPFSQAMTLRLSPFSREAESNPNKAKADNHVPSADTRDWVGGLAYVENDDPEEADQEVGDHNWRKPAWALDWAVWLSVKDLLFVSVLLLNLFTQFRLWHR
jgi:hypothetical protein